MPIYDVMCPSCKKVIIDHLKKMADPFPTCECGTQMQNYSAPAVHVWNEDLVFEHVGDTPRKFKTQKELKYYCREHGMISNYAEGCP